MSKMPKVTKKRRSYVTVPFGSEVDVEEKIRIEEAFGYLPKMKSGKHNFTSARPFPVLPKSVEAIEDLLKYLSKSQESGFSRGDDDFLSFCVSFFSRLGIKCSKEDISATPGILSSINSIYDRFLRAEKEDEFSFDIDKDSVIVPYPTFGYYLMQLKEKGMSFSTFETFPEEGFLPDPEKLEAHIASMKKKPKILLLCYPNNPTGVGMKKDVAKKIVEIARKHGIMIISDEVYALNSLYSKIPHYPIACVEGAFDCSVTLFNLSKAAGLTGIESGIILGNKKIVDGFAKLGGHSKMNQKIVSAVIDLDDEKNIEYFKRMRERYQYNIDLISNKLLPQLSKRIERALNIDKEKAFSVKIEPVIEYPEYSNVYLIKFSGLKGLPVGGDKGFSLETGLDVARFLYENAGVATVPGECSLFKSEDMVIRIALGHEPEVFKEAFESIAQAFEKALSFDYECESESSGSEHESGVDARGRTYSSTKIDELVLKRVSTIKAFERVARGAHAISSSEQDDEEERSSAAQSPLSFDGFEEEITPSKFESRGAAAGSPTPMKPQVQDGARSGVPLRYRPPTPIKIRPQSESPSDVAKSASPPTSPSEQKAVRLESERGGIGGESKA